MTKIDRRRVLGISGAVLMGLLAGALQWINGHWGAAIFSFALLTATGLVLEFSRSDWAVSQGPRADERQEMVMLLATRYAFLAITLVSVAGFFVELARDSIGPFTAICSVGGFSYMLALAVLGRRHA